MHISDNLNLHQHSPHHPILKHSQPTFLPQCEWPSFTPIQNKRQNYSSVYLSLFVFREQTGRQKLLHRMIANIPWLQSALNFFLNRILICKVVPKYLNCSTLSKNYDQSVTCSTVSAVSTRSRPMTSQAPAVMYQPSARAVDLRPVRHLLYCISRQHTQ